ncbi:hypothetical protein GUJ93_ZPchr0012g19631 [Zizania palustris]|uniref:Uncharacterized protein n=1 Tax=Zizania palustris TaxID=103762 RepID=A0A8J5WPD7_ZIZPA|nr:hypothetical protein GUJ93_ZPchr0012g19631 [Zizania palustris]
MKKNYKNSIRWADQVPTGGQSALGRPTGATWQPVGRPSADWHRNAPRRAAPHPGRATPRLRPRPCPGSSAAPQPRPRGAAETRRGRDTARSGCQSTDGRPIGCYVAPVGRPSVDWPQVGT